jgi:hypothetical protein
MKNLNQGQISKRPKVQYTKKAKRSGELAAGSLGDLQPEKKPPATFRNGFFRWTPRKAHQHTWIYGTDNAVCTHCGHTIPKDQAQ